MLPVFSMRCCVQMFVEGSRFSIHHVSLLNQLPETTSGRPLPFTSSGRFMKSCAYPFPSSFTSLFTSRTLTGRNSGAR